MLTDQEVINMLKRSLAMADDRTKTQRACDLKDDEFYPFMMGYLYGDLKFVITHLESKIKK